MKLKLIVASLFAISHAFNPSAQDNVVLYYGQNSVGGQGTQQRMSYYCDSDASDLIVLAFMNVFPTNNEVNFGPACNDGTTIPGTQLLQCPQLSQDIKYCQSKGKKVLLSLGGASGAYGFTSDGQAQQFATTLWNLFGAGTGNTTSERPFLDSVVDGFDLDIEGGQTTGYAALVTALKLLFAKDTTKSYYISAAPQCPLPDAYIGDAILNSMIDLIFVQFYNNYCGLQAYGTDNFNFADWDTYVQKMAKNHNARVYLGVPAGPSAAGSGYESATQVAQIANSLKKYSTFGGVMMWDASQAWKNDNFAAAVKTSISAQTPSNSASNYTAPLAHLHSMAAATESDVVQFIDNL